MTNGFWDGFRGYFFFLFYDARAKAALGWVLGTFAAIFLFLVLPLTGIIYVLTEVVGW